ncbi:polyprenyl synthetase family protein [Amycolatopsis sp. NPDC054798]
MLREIDELHPDLRTICLYHLGVADAQGHPVSSRTGQMVRACTAVLTAEAVGAAPADAVPSAVAIELVHNFTLLHDDLIDGDELRRGRPTSWKTFGPGPAVLAGDALFASALDVLARSGAPGALAAAASLTAVVKRVTYAWANEAVFDRAPAEDIVVDDYVANCAAKVEFLPAAATTTITLLDADPKAASCLSKAAGHIAAAWQIANDLEDIWGDPVRIGKPGLQDIREHKHTLPLIAALQSGHPLAGKLARLLETPRLTTADLAAAADLVQEAGGREQAEQVAHQQVRLALQALNDPVVPAPQRKDLTDIFLYAVTRDPGLWLSHSPLAVPVEVG